MHKKGYTKPTTEGLCPYCRKHIKSLENHIHDEHRIDKIPEKK